MPKGFTTAVYTIYVTYIHMYVCMFVRLVEKEKVERQTAKKKRKKRAWLKDVMVWLRTVETI